MHVLLLTVVREKTVANVHVLLEGDKQLSLEVATAHRGGRLQSGQTRASGMACVRVSTGPGLEGFGDLQELRVVPRVCRRHAV